MCLSQDTYLSTQVNDVGVRVIEGQQNAVAGVHLLDTYRFIHAVLERQNTVLAGMLTSPISEQEPLA